MKTVIIILLLLAYSLRSYSQPNLLKSSQNEVAQEMAKSKDATLYKASKNSEGNPYLCYSVGNNVFLTYYFKDDSCLVYEVIYPIDRLTNVVKDLNNQNIKITDTSWCGNDLRYQIKIEYSGEPILIFAVKFTSL